jgi:hypothetical protein
MGINKVQNLSDYFKRVFFALNSRFSTATYSGLTGIVFGLVLLGPSTVWFTNVEWLTSRRIKGDPQTSQVIWNFFRETPLLQWPLTRVSSYADGADTVFQSAVGLNILGVPLKYVEFLLPTNFQYLGFWLIICFFLQGYFGARLIGIWSTSKLETNLLSSMFLLSPIFLHRIGIMGHYDLGAHWILLAGLYLYFNNQFSMRNWTLIILVALWVNVYITAMIAAIFFAAAVKEFLVGKSSAKKFILGAPILLALSTASFFMLGYNEYGDSAAGTGFFRLNLGSFFYPKVFDGGTSYQSSSLIIEKIEFVMSRPFAAFEGEGFNFLGISSLFLLIPASFFALRNFRRISYKKHLPIFLATLLMLTIALSNQIVFIRRELTIPVPDQILELRQIFRSATRFAWPLTYLLVLYGLVALVKIKKKLLRPIAIVLVVALQFVDSVHLIKDVNRHFHDKEQVLLLNSDYWVSIGERIDAIRLVPTFDLISDGKSSDAEKWLADGKWFSLTEFSGRTRNKINFGYVARPTTAYVDRTNENVQSSIQSGNFERRAMYVFATPELWRQAIKTMPSYGRSQILDGFFLIITE